MLCVLFLLQMVLKGVHSLNVAYDSQGSWNESKIHCVKWSWKKQFPEGSLPWSFNTVNLKGVSHGKWTHYVIQCRGLERSQFKQFLLHTNIGSWNESIWWWIMRVLKGVKMKGLCAAYEHWVLKWVKFMIDHRGLERSQFLMICHIGHCVGLKRSQLLLYG